jgi:outer membrane protein OmpA-like peptidoglycan-associated protein
MVPGETLLHGARSLRRSLHAGTCLAALLAFPLAAQETGISDSEITARFRAQTQSIEAATAAPDLGRSRGLVLSPGGAAPATATAVTIAPAPEGPAPAAAAMESVAADPAATKHWALPKDEQVNVQVTFAFDSAAIADPEKPKLRQICGVLDSAGVNVLRIVGHTDSSGPSAYNLKLSELRAEEVKRFFERDCGIAADRLQALGVGEQFPFDEKDPAAGVNRRVEFQAIS